MKNLFLSLGSLCVFALQLSCNSLDVPPPPDIQPILQAYETPSADVTQEIMAEFGDSIEDARTRFQGSGILDQVVDLVVSVQVKIPTDEQGNLVVDGATFPAPDGAVAIDHVCRGWDPNATDPNEDLNGRIDLTMPLLRGALGPIIWGEAQRCRYPAMVDEQMFQVSFDGAIAMALDDPLETDEDLRSSVVTFVFSGTLSIEGETFGLDQSFRVDDEGRLEVLIRIDDDLTFVYFFEADSLVQGIRDTTGTFGCSLEEQQCAKTSGSFSWE